MPDEPDSSENPSQQDSKVVPLPDRRGPRADQPDSSDHPAAQIPEHSRPSVDPVILRKVRNRLKGEELTHDMFEGDEPEPPTVA